MRRGFLSPQRPLPLAEAAKESAAKASRTPVSLPLRFLFADSADSVNENLLVLLHGRGDRAAPFAQFGTRLALPQTATLALEGALEIPHADGGRGWFDAFEEDGELIDGCVAGERRRTASLARSVDALVATLEALVLLGWPLRKIHLFGFSDGGTVRRTSESPARRTPRRRPSPGAASRGEAAARPQIHARSVWRRRYLCPFSLKHAWRHSHFLLQAALELALRFSGPRRLGSCTAVSAALLPESMPREPAEALPPPHTPVLVTRGEGDGVVSLRAVMQTQSAMRAAAPGCGCDVVAVRGKGHGMPRGEEETRELMKFWASVLSARPLAAAGEEIVELDS